MIEISTREIRKLGGQLSGMKKALRFAERNTLNDLAFETRREAQENVREQMTLRNKWTERSIQVERAKRLSDPAIVGSVQEYMADQEFGGVKHKQGKRGVAIATSYSAGEGEGQKPRTRLPRARNRLARIKLSSKRIKAENRRQRNLVAVLDAAQTGRKEVYLDTGRKQFIARVVGGKRNPRVKMLHDLSRDTVTIPRNPWLLPATIVTVARRNEFYAKRLREQLERLQRNRAA